MREELPTHRRKRRVGKVVGSICSGGDNSSIGLRAYIRVWLSIGRLNLAVGKKMESKMERDN